MKTFFILLGILSFIHVKAQVNVGMPRFEQVVTTFFSRYQFASESDSYIVFEKRPEGWFIGRVNAATGTSVTQSQLFWNKASGNYENLPFGERDPDSLAIKDDVDSYMMNHIDESTRYGYERNINFGYEGWDWDVINNFQNKTGLSDTLLESLARAYSSYAITFFYPQWGTSTTNDDKDRVKLNDNEPVSISRARKFIQYENLAIDTYKKLKALNPHYMTLVGDINSKKSGEQMFAYTSLQFVGYDNEARVFLKDMSYPDSVLQKAKDILHEIKPNGILFTSGDNITYPVWFLQAQGIRKDVIAVDYTLLGLRRVIQYLDKKYKHTLFKTDSSIYMNPTFEYALYQNDHANNREITLDSFLNQLYGSNTLKSIIDNNRITYYTDDSTYKYFTKKVYLPVNKIKAQKLYGMKSFYKKIYIPMQRSYMLINDIIALSIANNCFLKKPVYFSFQIAGTDKTNGIIKRKLVWELTPVIE